MLFNASVQVRTSACKGHLRLYPRAARCSCLRRVEPRGRLSRKQVVVQHQKALSFQIKADPTLLGLQSEKNSELGRYLCSESGAPVTD